MISSSDTDDDRPRRSESPFSALYRDQKTHDFCFRSSGVSCVLDVARWYPAEMHT